MDWMYANCSTTAQRGALDWRHEFRQAVSPVFERLYQSVVAGKETRIVLEANSAADYKEKLGAELKDHAQIRRCGRQARLYAPCALKTGTRSSCSMDTVHPHLRHHAARWRAISRRNDDIAMKNWKSRASWRAWGLTSSKPVFRLLRRMTWKLCGALQ